MTADFAFDTVAKTLQKFEEEQSNFEILSFGSKC